jgi:hypothetical protein
MGVPRAVTLFYEDFAILKTESASAHVHMPKKRFWFMLAFPGIIF